MADDIWLEGLGLGQYALGWHLNRSSRNLGQHDGQCDGRRSPPCERNGDDQTGRLTNHAADQTMECGMCRGDERRVMMLVAVVAMVIVRRQGSTS